MRNVVPSGRVSLKEFLENGRIDEQKLKESFASLYEIINQMNISNVYDFLQCK